MKPRAVLLLFAVTIFFLPSVVLAEEIKQSGKKSDEVVDAKFIVVAGSLAGSTIFDVETTFAALGHGAREGNPIMRPFVERGRPAVYGFLGGFDGGMIYASYRMKKSANPNIRKLWWVIPVAATVGHAVAGGFNLRFAVTIR